MRIDVLILTCNITNFFHIAHLNAVFFINIKIWLSLSFIIAIIHNRSLHTTQYAIAY